MDEKVMLMEQERLSKEKKNKKNRKKIRIVGVVCLVAVIGLVWYLGWRRNMGVTEESVVQITTTQGQQIIYASLTSVKGNEITYLVAQEVSEEAATSPMHEGGIPPMRDGEIPKMNEEMPEGNGEVPKEQRESEIPKMDGEMQERNGEMPKLGNRMQQGNAEMADRESRDEGIIGMSGFGDGMAQRGNTSHSSDSFTYNNATYELTDESVTTQIPVGTDVITKLGTITTFSRLAAGDKVGFVVEEQGGEQIITVVYIIG